jgi:hypothetical protein
MAVFGQRRLFDVIDAGDDDDPDRAVMKAASRMDFGPALTGDRSSA